MKQLLWMLLGALIAAAVGAAVAQQGAQTVVGCIAHSAPPAAATEGQVIPLQCDLTGHLRQTAT